MNDETPSHTAPLHRRLFAAVYDLLPLLGLWFLAGVLAVAVTGGAIDPHQLWAKVLVQTLVVVLWAAYFVISWTRGGQTLGMRAWRLRVVDMDGGALSWRTSALRFVVALPSVLLLGCGFWLALFDPRGRTLYDRIAHTRVEHRANF